MSVSAVVFIVGAIFLIIGLVGGGIKIGVKEGEASIPKMNTFGRILAFVIGLGFIGFGLWRDLYPPLSAFIPTATPLAQMKTTEPPRVDSTPQVVQPTNSVHLPTISPTALFVPEIKCPSVISRQLIEQWSQIGETTKSDAERYIDEFDRMRTKGEFIPKDVLPVGVAIVTDFGNGESYIYQTLPVRAIVHYRSFGVFEITAEYTAVQTGACMTIMP